MIIVLDEDYRALAEKRFAGHELRFYPPRFPDKNKFTAMLADADILGMRRVLPFILSRDIVEQAPRLQFVHKSGSGVDHFDPEALSDHGVLLALNTGFNAVSVAEHAVALTLMAMRRTYDYAEVIKSGDWTISLPGDQPLMISGKTVGLIGVGAIGTRYAKAMQGLDAKVICYHPDSKRKMPPGTHWVDLDTLMRSSDIVSVQAPLTPSTAGMIGAREFGLMRPDAVLVNTSRGGIVDQDALVDALRSRRIRAAGIDVFDHEPLPADHPLRALQNVVATPHIAGIAKEINARQVEGTLANIALFLAGRRPERLINPEILETGRARASKLAGA